MDIGSTMQHDDPANCRWLTMSRETCHRIVGAIVLRFKSSGKPGTLLQTTDRANQKRLWHGNATKPANDRLHLHVILCAARSPRQPSQQEPAAPQLAH